MTYDQWKTTDPREFDPEPEEEPDEIDRVYDELREAQSTIAFLRARIAALEAKYEPEIVF